MTKLIPNGGNDNIQTPIPVAEKITDFLIKNLGLSKMNFILEPCCGADRNFVQGIFNSFDDEKPNVVYYDISDPSPRNFFDENGQFDWIITNPPWSQTRQFLNHAMTLAPRICFLVTVNHILALKARIRDMNSNNFWPTDILLLDTPKEFPQSGFQLGACVIIKTKEKSTKFHNL